MIICGIELTGSNAILAILKGSKSMFSYEDNSPRKIEMIDDQNSIEVRAYQATINAFFRENRVEKIAIKKRSKKGEFAGGAISFKIETVIQIFSECEVILISPQAIAASKRNNNPTIPVKLNKYQLTAFWTAFTALP